MAYIKNKYEMIVECPDRETVNSMVDALYRTFANGDSFAFDNVMAQLLGLFEGDRYDVAADRMLVYPWSGYLKLCREIEEKRRAQAKEEAEKLVPLPDEPTP